LKLFFSVIGAIILVCFVLVFYLFLGCSYELVKCYLEKRNDNNQHKEEEEDDDECSFGKVLICIILAAIGVFLQPIYMIFYLIYAFIELLRQFGCYMLCFIDFDDNEENLENLEIEY